MGENCFRKVQHNLRQHTELADEADTAHAHTTLKALSQVLALAPEPCQAHSEIERTCGGMKAFPQFSLGYQKRVFPVRVSGGLGAASHGNLPATPRAALRSCKKFPRRR